MIAVGPDGARSSSAKSWPFGGQPTGRYGAGGILWPLDHRTSYEALYRSQPWVYVVVNKLSRSIARLPLHVFRLQDAEGDRERVRDGTLVELLRAPYGLGTGFSPRAAGFRLKEHVVSSVAIYGNALLLKQRIGPEAEPYELWPLDWRRISVFTAGQDGPVEFYEYQQAIGPPVRYRPTEVVHVQWWGPEGLGISPLEPLRSALATETAAGAFQAASFANGIRPSGALVTAKNLRPEQRQEIKLDFEQAYSGVDRAGGMLLLDGGLDWKPIGGSAVDAQLLDTRTFTRDEVCAVYDIPPPMVGILDRATFSNIDEQHRMLYQDTLGPWLVNVEQSLQTQLIDPELRWAGSFVEFDLDEVLRGDVEKRSQAYQRFVMSGAYTPNEIRRMENLPAINNALADAVYVPLNMQAVGDDMAEGLVDPAQQQLASLLEALRGGEWTPITRSELDGGR